MGKEVDVYIGKLLQSKRREAGIFLNEMAMYLGVTDENYRAYEQGRIRIGSIRLYQISQILEVPVSYFFEGMNEQKH